MLTIRRSTANGLEDVNRDAVGDLVRRGDANLWFHFDTPTEAELQFLQQDLNIHHLTIEGVVTQNQRPKIEAFEDYVYLAIHPLMHNKKWQIGPSELDLLLGRHWIVSVHYGPLPGLMLDFTLGTHAITTKGTTGVGGGAKRRSAVDV